MSASMQRLVLDPGDAALCPGLEDIAVAIRNNPDCTQGFMSRKGWAFDPCGRTPKGGYPELLVRVAETGGSVWYAHVFFLADDGDPEDGAGCWISLLTNTLERIDGLSAADVLNNYRKQVIDGHKWIPGYRQGERDICSDHESLEKAILATARKIRAFRWNLRVDREAPGGAVGKAGFPLLEPPPDSELDLSCFDVYGFGAALMQDLKEGDQS